MSCYELGRAVAQAVGMVLLGGLLAGLLVLWNLAGQP